MTYIGIDPGKSGALAAIDEGAVVLVKFDEPAYLDTISDLRNKKTFCVLEHVNAMPGQGVTSMFNFGLNFGWIQGVLRANGIPFELVRPQKWKKEFGITSDKNTSISVAHKLFPEVSFRRTERCTKDDDGLAEALLIAEYARRHFHQ